MAGKTSAAAIPTNPINFMRIDCALVAALTRSATGLDQRPPLRTPMTAIRKSERPPATAGYGRSATVECNQPADGRFVTPNRLMISHIAAAETVKSGPSHGRIA
jgi:hypothetical protein